MDKSVFTPHYDLFKKRLVAMRVDAKLTQRQLAEKLHRERSFVSRIELGERRLDVVEFYWVCRACGCDPEQEAKDIMRQFASHEK